MTSLPERVKVTIEKEIDARGSFSPVLSWNFFVINPDECIDCGACEPACPVTAIFEENAVPQEWQEYLKINADYYRQKR